ncbi:hypothetical protein PTKIN_Ptkin11bG0198100 [Pterospermum kingtungense]
MGEEETKTEVPGPVSNGNSLPEKSGEAVAEKTEEENNGVKEMEEDKKVETEKMDEDQEVKESKEELEKKEKEEPETEAMEEETDTRENDKEVENEENNDEVEEKMDELKDKRKVELSKEWKGSKNRSKAQKTGEKARGKTKKVEKKKEPEPRTPLTDRPVRERKSVERLVASIDKDASREFQIQKGRGTALKDIPNVAFKLTRRKTDDTFRLLHTILFGRRGKAAQIKSNISRFSGFVWHENEEKQKNKVKEKFEKFNKEKLVEFCDVLDIPITKATTKKEDIVAKLIEFLEAPHATTTVLLAEQEKSNKGKKRKRSTKSGTTAKRSTKNRRKSEGTPKSGEKSTADSEDDSEEEEEEKEEEHNEERENENGVAEKSEDELPEDTESEEEKESEDESEEDAVKKKRSKKVAKGKDKDKEEKLKPSDSELRATICEILKEVDFNTATFTDILKLLAKRFDTDLTPRKSSIKAIIQEELTKLADEGDDEEDGEGDAAEKDETQSAGQEVEA